MLRTARGPLAVLILAALAAAPATPARAGGSIPAAGSPSLGAPALGAAARLAPAGAWAPAAPIVTVWLRESLGVYGAQLDSAESLGRLGPVYAGLEASGVSPKDYARLSEPERRAAVATALTRARIAVEARAEELAATAQDSASAAAARAAALTELRGLEGSSRELLTPAGRARVAALSAASADAVDAARTARVESLEKKVAAGLTPSAEESAQLAQVSELATLLAAPPSRAHSPALNGLARLSKASAHETVQLAAVDVLTRQPARSPGRAAAQERVSALTEAAVQAPGARAKVLALDALALERTAMLGKRYAAFLAASEQRLLDGFEAASAAAAAPAAGAPSGAAVRRPDLRTPAERNGSRTMKIFMAIVAGHWSEHLVQVGQVWILHMPRAQALGLLGYYYPWLIQTELLHYGYALAMLIGLIALRGRFRGNAATWWKVALGIQIWHHFEHLLLIVQATVHHTPAMSIIQLFVPRIELHMFYNTIVTIPMLVALWQNRRVLAREPITARPQIVGAVMMVLAAAWMILAALLSSGMPMCGMPGMR